MTGSEPQPGGLERSLHDGDPKILEMLDREMIPEESCSYRQSQVKREAMQAAGSRAGLAGIPSAFEIRMIPSRAPTAGQSYTIKLYSQTLVI